MAGKIFRGLELEKTVLMSLRDSLMQTMIQLSSKSAVKFNDAVVTSTVEADSPLSVKFGFGTLFELFADTFKLVLLLLFTTWLTMTNDQSSTAQKVGASVWMQIYATIFWFYAWTLAHRVLCPPSTDVADGRSNLEASSRASGSKNQCCELSSVPPLKLPDGVYWPALNYHNIQTRIQDDRPSP